MSQAILSFVQPSISNYNLFNDPVEEALSKDHILSSILEHVDSSTFESASLVNRRWQAITKDMSQPTNSVEEALSIDEILLNILAHVDAGSLAKTNLVSRRWRLLTADKGVIGQYTYFRNPLNTTNPLNALLKEIKSVRCDPACLNCDRVVSISQIVPKIQSTMKSYFLNPSTHQLALTFKFPFSCYSQILIKLAPDGDPFASWQDIRHLILDKTPFIEKWDIQKFTSRYEFKGVRNNGPYTVTIDLKLEPEFENRICESVQAALPPNVPVQRPKRGKNRRIPNLRT